MKLRKLVGKGINEINGFIKEHFDVAEECKDEYFTSEQVQAIIGKYMRMEEFIRASASLIVKDGVYKGIKMKYCLNNLDQIIDYKLKVSKGKKLNNDPREKAIIDLSDMLSDYTNKEHSTQIIYGIDCNKDGINIEARFFGRLCIPFEKCFIFTQVPNVVSQVIDIQHDLKGTYTGSVYLFLPKGLYIQMGMTITRENNYWKLVFKIPAKQKPLGTTCPNIVSIVQYMLGCGIKLKKEYDEAYPEQRIEGALCADMVTGVVAVFEMLDAYKNKYVFNVTNEDRNVFLYTNKKDIQEYIDTHYSGFQCNMLDKWLINGYWKFINPNDSGKTKDGGLIKGLDWVSPYKEETKDVVDSNGQQSTLVKVHAIQRAKERYNLDLTSLDLVELLNQCFHGGKKLTVRDKLGRLKTVKGKKGPYRVNYKGMTVDVAVDKSPMDKTYRIATFLPKPKNIQCTIVDSKDYNTIMEDCSR